MIHIRFCLFSFCMQGNEVLAWSPTHFYAHISTSFRITILHQTIVSFTGPLKARLLSYPLSFLTLLKWKKLAKSCDGVRRQCLTFLFLFELLLLQHRKLSFHILFCRRTVHELNYRAVVIVKSNLWSEHLGRHGELHIYNYMTFPIHELYFIEVGKATTWTHVRKRSISRSSLGIRLTTWKRPNIDNWNYQFWAVCGDRCRITVFFYYSTDLRGIPR